MFAAYQEEDIEGFEGYVEGEDDKGEGSDDYSDIEPTFLELEDAPIPEGRVAEWAAQNRTLADRLNPARQEIACFVTAKQSREKISKQGTFEEDRTVRFCSWSDNSHERSQFIGSTHRVFALVSKFKADKKAKLRNTKSLSMPVDDESVLPTLHQFSVKYRECIETYFEEVTKDDDAAENDTAVVARSMLSIWHLAEIVYFPKSLQESVGPLLMDWLNMDDPAPSKEEGDEIARMMNTHEHPQYWNYLQKCLIRDHRVAAKRLMECFVEDSDHSAAVNAMKTLLSVYETMPQVRKFDSMRAFEGDRMQWKMKATQKRNALYLGAHEKSLETQENIEICYDIILGDDETLANFSDTWQEHLAALMLFTYPSGDKERLPVVIDTALRKKDLDESRLLDTICAAIIRQDLHTAIYYCSQLDWWLVCHLCDLLEFLGLPEVPVPPADMAMSDVSAPSITRTDISMRDFLVMAYADTLVGLPNLWKQCIDYLITAGTAGRDVAKELVMHIPLESEETADGVLQLCERHDMFEEYLTLHKILGVKAIRDKQYARAINHFAKARDPRRVQTIANGLFENIISGGDVSFGNVLAELEPMERMYEDRIKFLSLYQEFSNLYKGKEWEQAAQVLLTLLSTEVTPKQFWLVILLDCIPLLEAEPKLFNADTVHLLLARLREIDGSPQRKRFLSYLIRPKASKSILSTPKREDRKASVNDVMDAEKKLQKLRGILAKNLAKSIMAF